MSKLMRSENSATSPKASAAVIIAQEDPVPAVGKPMRATGKDVKEQQVDGGDDDKRELLPYELFSTSDGSLDGDDPNDKPANTEKSTASSAPHRLMVKPADGSLDGDDLIGGRAGTKP